MKKIKKINIIISVLFAIAILFVNSKDFFHLSFGEIAGAVFQGFFFWLWMRFCIKTDSRRESNKIKT